MGPMNDINMTIKCDSFRGKSFQLQSTSCACIGSSSKCNSRVQNPRINRLTLKGAKVATLRRTNGITKMDYWLLFLLPLLLLGLLDLHRVAGLFVTDINVPEIVDFRDNVTLSCSYHMSYHTLNSVKWYKDEMEFFRYSPMMHPVFLKFPVDGIQVLDGKNYCNESACRVQLGLFGIQSSGVYRCEVSGDAPHFKLATRAANMTVAALPQNNPLISGFNSMYHQDEFVTANCSSDYSSLSVKLSWLINGEQASAYMELQPSVETTIPAHAYHLRRQSLPLSFYANDPRFLGTIVAAAAATVSATNRRRHLRLKCVAEIENFPELRRETTLNAALMHDDDGDGNDDDDDDDLSNQKLVNSGVSNLTCHLLLLTTIIITAVNWLTTNIKYAQRPTTNKVTIKKEIHLLR